MTQNPLGKTTQYVTNYSPELLFSIARSEKRDELSALYLKFDGEDIWNAYEISWLNQKGLPQIAIGEFRMSASSPYIIESKSLKLYLNSFNQTKFADQQEVTETITKDLSHAAGAKVAVKLFATQSFHYLNVSELTGELIDELDIEIERYDYAPEILMNENVASDEIVNETLISHLLKSNCLITSQPDWASIQITYQGSPINRANLLKYLVSFRSHNEFHEQCVERIYADIKKFCQPEKLSVYARYTRRGGLDINPWRSDFETSMRNIRLARQ
jgi:7-cyano-7-deazaguanine reductase